MQNMLNYSDFEVASEANDNAYETLSIESSDALISESNTSKVMPEFGHIEPLHLNKLELLEDEESLSVNTGIDSLLQERIHFDLAVQCASDICRGIEDALQVVKGKVIS